METLIFIPSLSFAKSIQDKSDIYCFLLSAIVTAGCQLKHKNGEMAFHANLDLHRSCVSFCEERANYSWMHFWPGVEISILHFE